MVQLVATCHKPKKMSRRKRYGEHVTSITSSPVRRKCPHFSIPERNHLCEDNSMETNGQSNTTGKRQINHQFAAVSPRPFEFLRNETKFSRTSNLVAREQQVSWLM